MITWGGTWSADTISAMKLAVMPMMVMREMACMPLTTVKVAPRAPKLGAILENVVGWDGWGLGDGLGRSLKYSSRGRFGVSGWIVGD